MVKPERRTRSDVFAAATIAVVVAVVSAVVWWTSDARATDSRPAVGPAPNPTPAREVPAALKELWTAASPRTAAPIVVDGTVVTGDGHEVVGRDPVTGKQRWSFTRAENLCAVSWVYNYAVAVYPDSRGCGQVSTIDGATGRRGPTRTSYSDKQVFVTSDGTTVLSAGTTRLELWRSDMVRMLAYGEIDARVKPSQVGVGGGCTLMSAAASSSAASVLQACKGETDLRLTLLRPGKEEDEPDLHDVPEKDIAADSGAGVLAVSDTTTAVYLPAPQPRVAVVDETGATVASTLLPKAPSAPATAHTVTHAGDLITWWTGDSVVVFDAAKLTYRYTVPTTGAVTPLGPATMMAGRLLIPVTGGLGVYDPATGAGERVIPVSRPALPTGTVVPGVTGSTVLEQRGDTIAALG
jgi:hypothetical protein